MISGGGWVASAVFSPKLRYSVIHGTSAVSCRNSCELRELSSVTRHSSSLAPRFHSRNFSGSWGVQYCTKFLRDLALLATESGRVASRNSTANHPQNFGCAFATVSQDSGNGVSWTAETEQSTKSSPRKTDLQVVLVAPQIPGNTGCIARTCAAAAVGLHLVEPLGFDIDSAKLRRAGLDYWPYVVIKVHKSWADFSQYFDEQTGEKRLLGFSKKGNIAHTAVKYQAGDWLVFGSETQGLPDAAVKQCLSDEHGGGLVRIPIDETYVRCLNLSVAAGIGVYEALRQLGYRENMLDTPDRDSSISPFREDIFC